MHIQKADPRARAVVAVAFALVMLAGGALLFVASIYGEAIEAWVREDLAARVPIVLATMAALTVGPTLLFAGYLWSVGVRIVRSRRYPPPGLWVVNDTPVLEGADAVARGRLMKGIALVIAACGALLAIFIWQLAGLIRPAA